LKTASVQQWIAALATAACALLLAGCAGSGGGAGMDSASPSGKAELKTLSDQTVEQKRAQIRMQLAIVYYQKGQYPIALDEIKQAIAADGNNADAYGVRALIYMEMGETTLAEDNFLRALKMAPQNPDLSNNYGNFLCKNGRAKQAIPYFEAAITRRGYSSPERALQSAGTCSMKLKNYEAAERYLLDAARYAPDDVSVNANLARVYLERRDMARAGFFIERVKTVGKTEELAADVLWLLIKVEHKRGDRAAEATLVTILRRNFPNSPEFAAFQRGAFDE
jgi:type IV pilus assembly protein PilF